MVKILNGILVNFIKKKRKRSIVKTGSASFPGPSSSRPPGGDPWAPLKVKVITVTQSAGFKAFLTALKNPVTSVYVGSLLGHTLPHFHQKVRKEGMGSAAAYLVGAIFKGDIDPTSSPSTRRREAIIAAHQAIKFMSRRESEKYFRSLENEIGVAAVKEIKQGIRYLGGFNDPGLSILKLHQMYFLFLIGLFIKTFVEELNLAINNDPILGVELGNFYSEYFIPVGFKINQKNYLLNSIFIGDEVYSLGIDFFDNNS